MIEGDVQRVPSIQLDYGIPGAGPLDLVASTGRLTFALNNGPGNSANLTGYYSPGHANCRSGFAIGIGIRLVYRLAGVTYYKFSGTLDSIDAISGKYGERKTLCTVVDWLDEAAIFRPNVATQVSKRADEILTTLVAAVPRQPKGTSFATGDSTFTYALDNDLNEKDPVLTVLQRLAQSENGRIYVKGDTTSGGILTFESRSTRYVPSSVATFNDTMIGLSAPFDRSLLINRVKATTHPRTVDAAATTVLFTLAQVSPSIHTVAGGSSVVIEGDYSDAANRSARVGGTDMVAPAATTDYLMNSAADGSGTNLTASFTVSAEYGSNRVRYTITNLVAATGYITKLQARGRGLYDYTPVDSIATDSDSITSYGERQLAMDLPYESMVSTALDAAEFTLSLWSTPAAVAVAMPLVPPTNTDLATMIAREPGQCVTITETVTGINTAYFINHVSMRFEDFQTIYFEWVLQKALATPVIRSRTTSVVDTAGLNHTVNMPSGIVSGDLLISIFTSNGIPTIGWPAGWTMFQESQSATLSGTISVAYRKADGTEGASITVTTSLAELSVHVTYRILGAADPATQPPQAATSSGAATNVFDCPALTPTGGKKNYLWIAAATIHAWNQTPAVSFYSTPANYSNTQFIGNTGGIDGWTTIAGDRHHAATSEDPGAFSEPASVGWLSLTVGVHPPTL